MEPQPTPPSEEQPPEEDEEEAASLPQTSYRLLIPLYSYPTWWDPNQYLWDDVAQARQQVTILAIINPNNGPNGPPNEDYQRGMQDLLQAGVILLGYIPTGYGQRSTEAIRLDVNLYADYFPVQGIFFDEVPTDTAYLSRYRNLLEYTRIFFPDGPIVFNYGTLPPQGYLNLPALDVVFEDAAPQWWLFSPEGVTLDPFSTGVLVHSASEQDMQAIWQDLQGQNWARYLYITDDTPPNPWDTLPGYWNALIQALSTAP